MSFIPTEQSDRRKFFVVVGIASVCVLWLSYSLISQMQWRRVSKSPDTPGWRLAKEINRKLVGEPDFVDVSVFVVTERPLQMKAAGAVHTQTELDRLQEYLKEAAPNATLEYQVELMRK